MDITDTQQAILDLIRTRLASEGMPPSQSEIAQAFGFSGVRAAQYHLEALEQAGAIQRVPGKARGIRLVPAPIEEIEQDQAGAGMIGSVHDDALRLPVLGRVAAGTPIGADIGSDDYVLLDRVFFSPAPDYLLKVKGDSMRDEGIFDGDLIGVHRTSDARSGQIVVARIDDEITVKR
jgi:repressor LexA